jgi:hypothetical protein
MQIVPRNKSMRGIKHGFGFLRISPPILRMHRENGENLQHTTRRKAYNGYLPVETARDDVVKLVVLTGCNIDFGSRIAGDRTLSAFGFTARC